MFEVGFYVMKQMGGLSIVIFEVFCFWVQKMNEPRLQYFDLVGFSSFGLPGTVSM